MSLHVKQHNGSNTFGHLRTVLKQLNSLNEATTATAAAASKGNILNATATDNRCCKNGIASLNCKRKALL